MHPASELGKELPCAPEMCAQLAMNDMQQSGRKLSDSGRYGICGHTLRLTPAVLSNSARRIGARCLSCATASLFGGCAPHNVPTRAASCATTLMATFAAPRSATCAGSAEKGALLMMRYFEVGRKAQRLRASHRPLPNNATWRVGCLDATRVATDARAFNRPGAGRS
jgi:hypothetical protein